MSARTSKTVTVGEWQAALEQVAKAGADVVPSGFKTIKQIAAELGVCRRHAWEKVARLVDAGRAEVRPFRLSVGGGGARPIPHYRIKP